MLANQTLVDEFIEKWKGASKKEMRDRLRSLPKRTDRRTLAEKDALKALLA